MSFQTADLCDAHSDTLQIVEPMFRDYGGNLSFSGPISTIKTYEDNTLVRAAVESPGEGRVLVVDAGGSMRCAMLGDNLAKLAVDNGWTGVVMYGCIRDSAEIGTMPLGVKALDTHPLKSIKNDYGQRNIEVRFGGATFRPGEYLYADSDGVILSKTPLVD